MVGTRACVVPGGLRLITLAVPTRRGGLGFLISSGTAGLGAHGYRFVIANAAPRARHKKAHRFNGGKESIRISSPPGTTYDWRDAWMKPHMPRPGRSDPLPRFPSAEALGFLMARPRRWRKQVPRTPRHHGRHRPAAGSFLRHFAGVLAESAKPV